MLEVNRGASEDFDKAIEDFMTICDLVLSSGGSIGPAVAKDATIHYVH